MQLTGTIFSNLSAILGNEIPPCSRTLSVPRHSPKDPGQISARPQEADGPFKRILKEQRDSLDRNKRFYIPIERQQQQGHSDREAQLGSEAHPLLASESGTESVLEQGGKSSSVSTNREEKGDLSEKDTTEGLDVSKIGKSVVKDLKNTIGDVKIGKIDKSVIESLNNIGKADKSALRAFVKAGMTSGAATQSVQQSDGNPGDTFVKQQQRRNSKGVSGKGGRP